MPNFALNVDMLFRRINSYLKADEATGFGQHSKDNTGRFYSKNGMPNIKKIGLRWLENLSWYHSLLRIPTGRFIAFIFVIYVVINLLFTCIYLALGKEHFMGLISQSPIDTFLEIFFFSTQTFTTVGYGRISPVGNFTSFIAAFEAFIGLLSFALATGLFFARFSQPESHIRFSKNALISPFKDGNALMFRLATIKNNMLSEVEIKIMLAVREDGDGEIINKFYPLDTTISRINVLSLSWTVVHPITDTSPLFGYDENSIAMTPMEILVFVKGFDEDYSNQVMKRTSYINTEIVYNAKFKIMYRADKKNETTILDFDLIDEYTKF